MNIKELINKTIDFSIKRLIETTGVSIVLASILVIISLSSYSPEDPNFIYNNNVEIKNILGSKGSYLSDILFQSLNSLKII